MRTVSIALLLLLQSGEAWKGAKEYKGAHFVLHSDAGDKVGKQALDWAEDVLAAFTQEFRGLADMKTPEAGMTIYYFKSRAGLDAHNKEAHGDRPGLKGAPGFFSSEDRIGHFTPDLPENASNSVEELVKHETTHQIAFYVLPSRGNPTAKPHFWAWEGLAAYFESTQRKGKSVTVGSATAMWLKKGKELVGRGGQIGLKEYVQRNQEGVRGTYPQAAVLCHFFMNGRKGGLREAFFDYLKVVHAGEAEADSFERIFSAKPESFESEFAAHVRGMK